MTVILLGVFSETGRPALSLSSVSMSLIMTQRALSKAHSNLVYTIAPHPGIFAPAASSKCNSIP